MRVVFITDLILDSWTLAVDLKREKFMTSSKVSKLVGLWNLRELHVWWNRRRIIGYQYSQQKVGHYFFTGLCCLGETWDRILIGGTMHFLPITHHMCSLIVLKTSVDTEAMVGIDSSVR